MNRKDSKGRRLRDGEGQRKNGCYMYRYTDLLGARQVVYSWKLLPTDPLPKGKKEDVSLREKEKEIEIMLKGEDSVQAKTLTVNDVFDIYLRKKKHKGRALAETTKINYKSEWDKNIRNTVLGNKTIAEVRKAHVISLYENLLENGLSYGTVMFFHKLLNSVFNYAMDVLELIDKNPCRSALNSIEGSQAETKTLTKSQDRALMDYVRNYSEGMDVSVLQYIMRHKSSYTTMRFYNHVTEERVIDTFQDHINKNAQDGFEKHIHRSA